MLYVRCLIATLLLIVSAAQAEPNPLAPSDNVLISYAITPEMERQFGADSASVSTFWDQWRIRHLSYAYLTLLREAPEAVKAASDAFDAQMIVYSAYGVKGVYFLFDIIDDDYPGRLSQRTAWMYDVVDLLLDRYPSSMLCAHPVSCLCDTTGASEISATMVQIQYACGGDTADTRIDINYYDGNDGRCNSRRFAHRFQVKDAAAKMGIVARVVRASNGRRMQEWLVPYAWVGYPGLEARPAPGTRAALVINYNDADTCDYLQPNIVKKLSWAGRGNPFGQKGAWGDLEFGPPVSVRTTKPPVARGSSAGGARAWGPKTPPMGWNPWNAFGGRFNEEIVKGNADALIAKGLQKAGYVYVNLDGNLRILDAQKSLSDYVHAKGLKFGVYGNHDAGFAIMGHEKERVAQWASMHVDYLKYDAYVIPLGNPTWIAMRDALKGTGIVYSVHCGNDSVSVSSPDIGHVWRTGPDILVGRNPSMLDVFRNAFLNNQFADLSGPGYFNDPDMLLVGMPGGLTLDQERSHFGLWCVMAAPLLIGCDLRSINDSSLAILLNKDAIAVNQDPLGYQGRIVHSTPRNAVTVWLKKMRDGGWAVFALNATASPREVALVWKDLGCTGRVRVRNIWTHADVKDAGGKVVTTLPVHGSAFFRLWNAAAEPSAAGGSR